MTWYTQPDPISGIGVPDYGPLPVIATGSTEARTLADRFADVINVKDYGAIGDGITDDYASLVNAEAARAAVGGVLEFPPGTYNVSATLTIETIGAKWIGRGNGVGQQGTAGTIGVGQTVTIRATHSAGPVIRVKRRSVTLEHIAVTSNASRYSGAAGSNYGIQVEGVDDTSPNARVRFLRLLDVLITEQPNHGLVMVGDTTSSVLEQLFITYNFGHGIIIDNGTVTSRTNLERPGQVNIRNSEMANNAGHAIALGVPAVSNGPYRVVMSNLDMSNNAWDSGIYYQHAQMYAYDAENTTIAGSAFGDYGFDDATMPNGTARVVKAGPSAGIYLGGRSWQIEQPRFVGLYQSVVGRANLDGISITRPRVFNAAHGIADQVIGFGFDTPTDGLRFEMPIVTDITTVLDNPGTNYDAEYQSTRTMEGRIHALNGVITPKTQIEAQPLSLNDDQAAYLTFSAVTRGIITISGNTAAAKGGIVHFRVGDGSNHATVMSSSGANVTGTTGTLAGTTGTDTHLTIAADNATNRLYIENRTGGARSYTLSISGCDGGIYQSTTTV